MCRVLAVEDDACIRECLVTVLETHGHAVVEAGSLYEARAILATGAIEVAVVDGFFPTASQGTPAERFPVGHGLTLLREARDRGVWAVLYSAEFELVKVARTLGYAAVLKPASIQEILEAVECRTAEVRR